MLVAEFDDKGHYGNSPNAMECHLIDEHITKGFNIWLQMVKADLKEEEAKEYESNKEKVISDFIEVIKDQLNNLVVVKNG